MLKWLFVIPRVVFKLWFLLVFFLSMLVLYVPFRILLRKRSGYPKAFQLMRRWGTFLNYALLVPLKIRWEGPLPPAPYVVCFNHGSYLDIIHSFNVLPDYFLFMGKRELLKWPLFNIFFKDMHIVVDRSSRIGAARSFVKARNSLDQGISVSIFPEGTIPRTAPRMKSFKDGAFKLAIQSQVPIVPITFVDNWRLFGDPLDLFSRGRPGIARVVVHPFIETKGLNDADLDNLRLRVYEVIDGPLRRSSQESTPL